MENMTAAVLFYGITFMLQLVLDISLVIIGERYRPVMRTRLGIKRNRMKRLIKSGAEMPDIGKLIKNIENYDGSEKNQIL